LAATVLAMALAWPNGAAAGTLLVCRTFDIASPLMSNLVIPAGTLFRDNGRADDPLAAFTRDYWQLRLETIAPAIMPPLQQCVRVLVRVTSDSSVKAVAAADNRAFVYAGSNLLLDKPLESEELLTLTGKVLDQVP
jgi:hypothetical protein